MKTSHKPFRIWSLCMVALKKHLSDGTAILIQWRFQRKFIFSLFRLWNQFGPNVMMLMLGFFLFCVWMWPTELPAICCNDFELFKCVRVCVLEYSKFNSSRTSQQINNNNMQITPLYICCGVFNIHLLFSISRRTRSTTKLQMMDST